jgi:sugar O-acyltransferase (sialic acid O-acetyltransferase NeuD family)
MQTMKHAQVIGAGGHARVVIAALQASGIDVTAVYDDDPQRIGQIVLGVTVRGPIAQASLVDLPTVLAIGDNRRRQALAGSLALRWIRVIHPRAWVHDSVRVEPGAVICAGAIVQPGAIIGAHTIINTTASIDHDCVINDFAHVGPGATLCGGVSVETGALVGVGACARPHSVIGAWSTVGAGAVVIESVPAGVTAVGCPARSQR